MDSPQRAERILGFDGLRAIAVTLVFLDHFVLNGRALGRLGVDQFFVLSGVLIVGILHRRRASIESGESSFRAELAGFWSLRARRLLPLYYAVLGLFAIATWAHHRPLPLDLPWYLAFVGNIYLGYVSQVWGPLCHLWTLSVEQQFYVLASIALLLAPRRRHLFLVSILLICALELFTLDAFNWVRARMSYVSSVQSFGYMAAGGLLALRPGLLAFDSRVKLGLVVAALVGLLGANFAPRGALADVTLTVIDVACCYIVCVGTVDLVRGSPTSLGVRLLEWPPLRYFGRISYGFYILHFLSPHFPTIAGATAPLPRALLLIAQFAATLAASALSWEFFEKRFQPGQRRAAARPHPAPPAHSRVPDAYPSRL